MLGVTPDDAQGTTICGAGDQPVMGSQRHLAVGLAHETVGLSGLYAPVCEVPTLSSGAL